MAGVWIPETLEALDRALRDGVLVEGHQVDFKRELAAGAASNKALAKDLASFAIDGGQLFFGVDESPTPKLRPIDLKGLKDRVDQVARASVTPPLAVRCIELVAPADTSSGCPSSPGHRDQRAASGLRPHVASG